jgi:hypothetical protein
MSRASFAPLDEEAQGPFDRMIAQKLGARSS